MLSKSASSISNILKLQSKAISDASERLRPEEIEEALRLLSTCHGKVILVGVGKSGIIAQKIAATLTSVGSLAVSLHACDALHGDLGIVTQGDVVIMFSNSGSTEELLVMLPHLKRRQVPIIAIVGNPQSLLAEKADVVLDASVEREACPLNLAPTTSTTVALAIGDALAMNVMQIKGLTPEDFALNHPAGKLGKRLTLRVSDLMHDTTPITTLSPEASWVEVILAIGQGGLGAVNVIDSNSLLLGIITDGDIRRFAAKLTNSEIHSFTAADLMTHEPVVVTPDVLAYDALKLMEERKSQISVLPVVNSDNQSLGILRIHDIVRSGL